MEHVTTHLPSTIEPPPIRCFHCGCSFEPLTSHGRFLDPPLCRSCYETADEMGRLGFPPNPLTANRHLPTFREDNGEREG